MTSNENDEEVWWKVWSNHCLPSFCLDSEWANADRTMRKKEVFLVKFINLDSHNVHLENQIHCNAEIAILG